jgi:hypothetical protein
MSVGFRQSSWIALVLALGTGPVALADPPVLGTPHVEPGPDKDGNVRRRVYVLHSGIHTILANKNKNIFAENMRDSLIKRGVAERDIVVLPTPYPTARWFNMFPKQCLTWFMDSADPNSWVPQAAYARMDQALKSQDVGPNDDLVWIGHSAGGQMGLTVAFLAANHEKYPTLAHTLPYHFHMVITLGSPIVRNLLPPEIEARHYLSPRDQVPRRLAQLTPPLLWMFGYHLPIKMPRVQSCSNCKVRLFLDIQHHDWDVEERVADRIVAEQVPGYFPLWQPALAYLTPRWAWLPALCQTLDAYWHVTIEDPLRVRR